MLGSDTDFGCKRLFPDSVGVVFDILRCRFAALVTIKRKVQIRGLQQPGDGDILATLSDKGRNHRAHVYFDDKAADYEQASERFPWNMLRRSELAAVDSLLGDVAGKSVLELGCGSGFYTSVLAMRDIASITAVDLSENMLSNIPNSDGPVITPVVADAQNYRDGGQYDMVFSAGLLEFVDSPAAVLETAHLHVEPDGRLLLLVPGQSIGGMIYKLFHRMNGLRINLFSKQRLTELAAETGWRISGRRTGGLCAVILNLEPA